MAVRTKQAAPVAGRDYFAVVVDIQDDSLEIKDRDSGNPKEVEITRFAVVVDTETSGYFDMELVAWGDTGRPAPWSDRSLAGKVYKAAARQEIPANFDDQDVPFKPFMVTLKEQLNNGNSYMKIDQVKPIPHQLFEGKAADAIKGQIDELLVAAKSGKQVVTTDQRQKAAAREQTANENGQTTGTETDDKEWEDIPF